jgi:hypothetical protein
MVDPAMSNITISGGSYKYTTKQHHGTKSGFVKFFAKGNLTVLYDIPIGSLVGK